MSKVAVLIRYEDDSDTPIEKEIPLADGAEITVNSDGVWAGYNIIAHFRHGEYFVEPGYDDLLEAGKHNEAHHWTAVVIRG